MRSALTDVAWVPTAEGLLSPEECLRRAHEIRGLDLERPAFEISASLRFLSALIAVALQEAAGSDPLLHPPRVLSPDAITTAIRRIGSAADLDDPRQPFFQRPALEPTGPKDGTRAIAIRDGSVRKLSPSLDPETAQAFWQFSSPARSSLPEAEAVLALVVFHHFFPAGNNSYAGDKTVMGAPGLRFLGKENTATECVWVGGSLLESSLRMIPREWLTSGGLPAWADRDCTQSRTGPGAAPLWRATWSSNAVACRWEGQELVGVRVGGIPQEWGPPEIRHQSAAQWKPWWDRRNEQDPFYLYQANDKGELKAVRLDLGRSVTELAVEWNSRGRGSALKDRSAGRLVTTVLRQPDIMFLRHQIFGTASSPSIRASQTLVQSPQHWAPEEASAQALQAVSQEILQLHFHATRAFTSRKPSRGDRLTAYFPSKALEHEASTAFWRRISTVFDDAVFELATTPIISRQLASRAVEATVAAVEDATEPMRHQANHKVEYIRAEVSRSARHTMWERLRPAVENADASSNERTAG